MSLEGMIIRFKGKTKDEMIAKYNSKNCAPMWTDVEKLDAKEAMRMLLSGEVKNVKIVKDPLEEIKAMPDNLVIEEETKTEEEIFDKEVEDGGKLEIEEDFDLSNLPDKKKTVEPKPVVNAKRKPKAKKK